jgi:peptidoglycan/LPS O-acetylase OafA/YrhL
MDKYNSFVKSALSAKLDSIQGLRALAVLLVIGYHYGFPVKNGFIGVDVFFVISGFVITQSLLRNNTGSRLQDLSDFYIKRTARLFPAFFVVFLFTMLAVFLVYSPNVGVQQNAIKGSLGAMLALSNFAIPRISGGYFGASSESNPFLHTWSLSVEEQFYLIYPLLFFFLIWLTKRNSSKKIQNLVIAFVILFSFSLTINLEPFSVISSIGTLTYFAPQARAWEFLLGCIVALNPLTGKALSKLHLKVVRFVAIAVIILFSILFPFNADTSLFLIVIPVASTTLFLALCFFSVPGELQNQDTRNLSTKVLVHLGDLSYSLYLWHWPIYVTGIIMFPSHKPAVVLASISLTYLMSLLTFKHVETKFNSIRIVSKRFWVLTLIFGQLISASIIFFMYTGVSKGWNQDWALNTHKVMSRGCDSGDIDFEKCYWGDAKSNGPIYLVGDSMSWAIADSVIDFSLKQKIGTQTLIRNACSITKSIGIVDTPCTAWREKVIGILLKKNPKLVIIANSNGYPEQDLLGMGSLIRELNSGGIKVLFILPPPGGDEFSDRRALAFRAGNANRYLEKPETISLDRYGLEDYQNPNLFQVFDPSENLCRESDCVVAKDGKDYYTYGSHLSVYANKVLEPVIRNRVLRLLQN